MKITKDTQLVWNLEENCSLIATFCYRYYVRISGTKNSYIVVYTRDEMKEVFGLTGDQFANIEHSGI